MQYNIVGNWLNNSRYPGLKLATVIYCLEANGIITKKHSVGPKAVNPKGLTLVSFL